MDINQKQKERLEQQFAFKYGKFLLPPRFLTALSVPKVPTRV